MCPQEGPVPAPGAGGQAGEGGGGRGGQGDQGAGGGEEEEQALLLDSLPWGGLRHRYAILTQYLKVVNFWYKLPHTFFWACCR